MEPKREEQLVRKNELLLFPGRHTPSGEAPLADQAQRLCREVGGLRGSLAAFGKDAATNPAPSMSAQGVTTPSDTSWHHRGTLWHPGGTLGTIVALWRHRSGTIVTPC